LAPERRGVRQYAAVAGAEPSDHTGNRLCARRLRISFQRFAERRGLSEPRPTRGVQLTFQAIDPTLQSIVLALELILLLAQSLLLTFSTLRPLPPAGLIPPIRWPRIFRHDLLMPESSLLYKRYPLNNYARFCLCRRFAASG
jgi:hypothetical protein